MLQRIPTKQAVALHTSCYLSSSKYFAQIKQANQFSNHLCYQFHNFASLCCTHSCTIRCNYNQCGWVQSTPHAARGNQSIKTSPSWRHGQTLVPEINHGALTALIAVTRFKWLLPTAAVGTLTMLPKY